MSPVSEDIQMRQWRCISRTLGRDGNNNTEIAATRVLKVKGRTKSTGRRTGEVDRTQQGGSSWKVAGNAARGRTKWQK